MMINDDDATPTATIHTTTVLGNVCACTNRTRGTYSEQGS